ncbi:MAG: hypothetical protein R3F29_14845 [Planctomycetota bacterium]
MRTFILCCVVAVLALGSWLLLRGDAEVAPTPNSQPQSPAEEPLSPETPAPAVAVREAAVDVVDHEQVPIPDDAVWVDLLVVDAVTKEPAPGVEVSWSHRPQQDHVNALPAVERDAVFADEDQLVRRFGWRTTTDPQGRARISTMPRRTSVVARDALRYGIRYLSPEQQPPEGGFRLELKRDQTLLVHVTDAAGADASGVRVGLLGHEPDSPEPPRWSISTSQVTDANGIATYRHVQDLLTWPWGPRQGATYGQMLLRIHQPGIEQPPQTLDPKALPIEPVELQLPATGELVVRVLFENAPLPHLQHLMLHRGPKDDAEAHNAGLSAPLDADGTFHFRHLPLDRQFVVEGYPWGAEVAGPTRPGEVAAVTLEIADRVFALSGRLHDERGPLAEQKVPLQHKLNSGGGGGQVETDRDGRFLWIVREVKPHLPQLEIEHLSFELRRGDEPPLRCEVAPRTLQPGRTELGDLFFGDEPLLVSGRLVYDCDGPRATLSVKRMVPTRSGREGSWRPVHGLRPKVDADGTFEIRGRVEPGRYRLELPTWSRILPVAPIEFQPGAAGLQIDVRCGNELEASCLLDESIDASLLRLTLVPALGSIDPEIASHVIAEWRGRDEADRQRTRHQWQAVPDGTYTLRITSSNSKAIVEIPELVVPQPAGGDARLTDIDLRAKLRLLHLTARRGPGHREEHAAVMVFSLPQGDDAHWQGTRIAQSELLLPVPPGPQDLLVAAEGSRPVTLRGVQDRADVVLEPWSEIELTFPQAATLPEGVTLAADSRPPAAAASRSYDAQRESGSLADLLGCPGTIADVEHGTVKLSVGNEATPLRVYVRFDGYSKELQQRNPAQVVAGQPVTVQLDAEELREVVVRLQTKAAGK